jgi:hypothetical protein
MKGRKHTAEQARILGSNGVTAARVSKRPYGAEAFGQVILVQGLSRRQDSLTHGTSQEVGNLIRMHMGPLR